jgi:hypothetical protein
MPTFTGVARKQYTADEVQQKQDKAVKFLRDVVGDDDKASEFEDMSLDEYAQHKNIQIVNRGERSPQMANGDPRTKSELLAEIDDLNAQLDAINDVLNPPDDDDDDGDDGTEYDYDSD